MSEHDLYNDLRLEFEQARLESAKRLKRICELETERDAALAEVERLGEIDVPIKSCDPELFAENVRLRGALEGLRKEIGDLATHPETATSPQRQRGIRWCAKRINDVWFDLYPLRPRKYS